MIKFEVYVHPLAYVEMKVNLKCTNLGGLVLEVTQGHRQCHHLIDHVRLPIRL